MPAYRYLCVNLKGEYFHGEHEARDKNDLAWTLWETKLFLVWWEEYDPAQARESTAAIASPMPASPGEVEKLLQNKINSERTLERPAPKTEESRAGGILGWIIIHSKGAVRTRKQAFAIASLMALVLIGTSYNAWRSLRPETSFKPNPNFLAAQQRLSALNPQ
jgi:hypothetical protein